LGAEPDIASELVEKVEGIWLHGKETVWGVVLVGLALAEGILPRVGGIQSG